MSGLRFTHVGVQFGLIVGGLTYGGIALDRELGTSPLWTLLGLASGFAAALYHLLKEVSVLERSDEGDE